MRSLAFMTLTVSLALLAGEASAHIQLMSPTQRHSEQKAGPCGVGPDDARGPNVTTYKPGETITVVFDEHVNHPGHFRISFDDDGHDGFADPEAYDDFYTNEYVLLDDIADKDGGIYEVEVTLPNIECDNCTLQVQQTMTDKPPFGPGGGVDFYWQCADIRLEGEVASTTTTMDPGTTTAGDETFGGTADPSDGETTFGTATGTAGEGEGTAGPGESTAGEEPTATSDPDATTGMVGTDSGVVTGTATDGATSAATATATETATDPSTDDDDKGCGCRGDVGGGGWLALLVVPLARRRRHGRA